MAMMTESNPAPTQSPVSSSTFFSAASPTDDSFGPAVVGNAATPAVPASTGPVGEPGLPPSRPATTTTNRTGASTLRGPSAFSAGARSSYQSDSSRPFTGSSKTHVPNLVSSAFMRPTSSRRTRDQTAQNSTPPPPHQLPIARKSSESGRRSHRHRNSNASIVTVDNQRPLVDPDAPPMPTSRGTAASAREVAHDGTTLDTVNTATSATPLQTLRPAGHFRPDPNARSSSLQPLPPRSPRSSLRASWSRQSRGSRTNVLNNVRDGHQKLESQPPSPGFPPNNINGIGRDNLGRNYQYFSGNAIFFLRGRLMNARQRPLNLCTAFLAVLPAALFFGFSAPWLWHHVSPAIPILFAYVFYLCISSYLHASFTEPGILPRNLHPHPPTPANEDPLALGPSTTEWVTVRSYGPSADGDATAMEVPIKFCKSCNIWRPPRAHHCRVCDSCIETQDHHCVWLNNCVGRRNYRYFLTFVASGTLLGFFLLAASLAHILVWRRRHHATFGHAINVWRVPFAMCIYAILIIPYPASLWGYHLFLTGRGETTREYLNSHKFLPKDRHRPFSQHSILRNWASIVTRPRPPTYMRFKHGYSAGDQRLGEKRRAKARKSVEKQGEKNEDVEMKEMSGVNGSTNASTNTVGFQGPRGRGMINNTPRGDVPGSVSTKA